MAFYSPQFKWRLCFIVNLILLVVKQAQHTWFSNLTRYMFTYMNLIVNISPNQYCEISYIPTSIFFLLNLPMEGIIDIITLVWGQLCN
jgi:hypothetical protein